MARHVVWDWNGTLLDDFEVVLNAVNAALRSVDGPTIDEQSYRDHYTRPVKRFYEGVYGRPISDGEWNHLNEAYHTVYYANVHDAPLTGDALQALDLVDGGGSGQSLLSMTPQERLEAIVLDHGLLDRLDPVTGLPAQTGGLKAEHMMFHLRRQALPGETVVVIGDTPDDAVAARAVGAKTVLYDGGSHHRHHLDDVGVPVAGSLVEAVEIALSV